MDKNNIETSTDIDYGTISLRKISLRKISLRKISLRKISLRKRGKSIIKIGNMKFGGTDIKIEVSTKFNWLQKKLWKYLLNIDIEDVKED